MNDIIDFVKENLTAIIIVVVIIIMALIGRYGDKRLQEKKRRERLLAMKTNKNTLSNYKDNNSNDSLIQNSVKPNEEISDEKLSKHEEIVLEKIASKEDLKENSNDEEHWEL